MCACSFHPYGLDKLATAEASPTSVRVHRRFPAAIFWSDSSILKSLSRNQVHSDPNQKKASNTNPRRKPPCTFPHGSVRSGRTHKRKPPGRDTWLKVLRSVESSIQNHARANSQLSTCGRARKWIIDAETASSTNPIAMKRFVPLA